MREEERDGPLVLALDVGTSSVRAALYTEEAREVSGTQARTPTGVYTTIEGGAELRADEALEQVARTVDAALSRIGERRASLIETVAVSCFWHSLVGVDDEGRAITPVMGWADTRAAVEAEALRRSFDEQSLHDRTGARLHPSYWPAKLLWIKRTRPETFRAVRRWLSFSDFLWLKLFGKAETSVSMASGTGLFALRSCEWDEALCRELGIFSVQLPEVAETDRAFRLLAGEYAKRWPALKAARWFPAVADGAANNIGAGCTSTERIALMIGTSGAMRLVYEGKPPQEIPESLWCYRVDRRRVVLGGALSDGGGLWAWMNEALRVDANEQEVEEALAAMEPDSHGLTVLPFWAGERSTGWNGFARGAVLGLSMHTRPLEIMRAGMEAVAYRFASLREALAEFAPRAALVATGGAIHASNLWAQIISDAMGRPIEITGAEESSSRGAVLLALEASDKIKSIGEERAPVERVVEPDAARREIYMRARLRHEQLYKRLVADEETARLINDALPNLKTKENRGNLKR
ncbi:MAG TPA: gluconokinase [Pyrinomonadaceae bacterium]|nr:gluconokinase [Pyrinomonadaceae bacterium]